MRATRIVPAIVILSLVTVGLLAPAATAHERYFSSDDKYLIVLGEQNEPVYTYDWTNLDFFVRDNATGVGIEGVEETVNVTLIAPNGEELALPIEPQHGSTGKYEFTEDYFLTLPGQYKVRLEGQVNGTDISGEYLLPGPRGDMKPQAFPVPLDHDLRELSEANEDLQAQVDALQAQVDALETKLAAMDTSGGGDADQAGTNNAPGLPVLAVLAVAGLVVLLRERD